MVKTRITKLLIVMVAAASSLSLSALAIADDASECIINGTILPPSQIEINIKNLGYTVVPRVFHKAIKLGDECIYKARAKDKDGQEWRLYFDPVTGKLISKKRRG
jgi:hypothetical protein